MLTIEDGVLIKCDDMITEVEIPNTVKKIAENAFYHCSITSLVLPESITEIEAGAFYRCRSLTSIVIPDGIETIRTRTFSDACSLTSLSLPASLKEIEPYSFIDCAKLKTIDFRGTLAQFEAISGRLNLFTNGTHVEHIQCTDGIWNTPVLWIKNNVLVRCLATNATQIVIPKTIVKMSGNEVKTSHLSYVFEDCKSLEHIDFEGTIQEWNAIEKDYAGLNFTKVESVHCTDGDCIVAYKIEDTVFKDCYNLYKTFTIPDGVTKIDSGAFRNCSALQSVIISEGVTEICSSVFSGNSLTTVTLPGSIKKIDSRAFYDCHYLETVDFKGTVEQWKALEIDGSLFEPTKVESVHCVDGDCIVGYKIENSVFKKCYLMYQSFDIPDGVTEISSNAFNNPYLTTVSLPESLKEIEVQAFNKCEKLYNIIYRGTTAEWESVKGKITLLASRVTCDDGVWERTKEQIEELEALKMLKFENGVLIKCNEYATEVVLPDTLKTISEHAFEGCKLLTSIVIPDSVKELGNGIFNNCESLSFVTLPKSISSIPAEAFYHCNSLTSIVIPDGVKTIGEESFFYCDSLTSIVIPKGVCRINRYAFRGCEGVKEIVIPDTVKVIQDGAFEECKSLKSVTLPDTGISLGENIFSDCSALESVSLPNGMTTIPRAFLLGCSSLRTLSIPISITTVEYDAFAYCENLKDLIYEGTREQWKKVLFDFNKWSYFPETMTIKCSDGDEKVYADLLTIEDNILIRAHPSVKNVSIPDNVTEIAPFTFTGNKLLESVTIPDNVTFIGKCAFDRCESLKQIELSNNIDGLRYELFRGCKALESIKLPDSVRIIDCEAFLWCTKLKEINFPDGLEKIGYEAFSGCSSLESVELPDTVVYLGYCAFFACSSLKKVRLPKSIKTLEVNTFKDCTSLKQIDYAGTLEEWNKIKIEVSPKNNYPIPYGTVIKCADGETVFNLRNEESESDDSDY